MFRQQFRCNMLLKTIVLFVLPFWLVVTTATGCKEPTQPEYLPGPEATPAPGPGSEKDNISEKSVPDAQEPVKSAKDLGGKSGAPVANPLAEQKEEYIRFAEQFSMRTGSGYFEEFRLEAPDRAEKIKALALSQPVLKKAGEEFPPIAVMYATAQKLLSRVQSTPEETARMQKLYSEGRGDDEKMKAYLGEALKGWADQIKATQVSTKLLDEAMQKHAAAWKTVVPLAGSFAGSEKIDSPVRFVFSTVPALPSQYVQYGLSVVNTAGKTLTNVTIAVESNISTSLQGEAKRNYVFLKVWKDREDIPIHNGLVDMFPRLGAPRPTKKCLTYSIWSDQTAQENVVLEMRTPEPINHSPGGNSIAASGKSFVGYAFNKEGERPPMGPDLLKVGSSWIGTLREIGYANNVTTTRLKIDIIERNATKFTGRVKGAGFNGIINGTVEEGVIKWQKAQKQVHPRDEPGPPAAGEINGSRIEVAFDGRFGASGKKQGTISLVVEQQKEK